MAISQTQFEYLTEMGISLWTSKSVEKESENTSYLEINQQELTQSKCFLDILTALGISIEDISFTQYTIDLGQVNWQFHSEETVKFSSANLITPSIEKISNSIAIKRQLWQVICENQLNTNE